MTEPNHRPTPDILEQATEALRNAPVPPGPPAELLVATVAAIPNRFAEVHRQERRRRIMRYIRYGSAASIAAGLLIAVGVLWLGSGSAAAFHRAADKAAAAKTVVCKHTQKIGKREMPFRAYYREGAYRMELLPPDGTETPVLAIIADLKAGKGLQINFASKTAKRLSGPMAAGAFPNLVEQFRKLKGKKAELVGEEKINSQSAKVYRVKGAEFFGLKLEGKDELRVWIDPKTELPVRVRADIRSSPVPQQFTWEEFRWNEKLDPKLFSLDVPKGYTVEGEKKPTPPESEPDSGPTQFILFRTMDEVEKATSMRAVVTVDPGQGQKKLEMKLYQEDQSMRAESADPGLVVIVKDKKCLVLLPQMKTAWWLDPKMDPIVSKVTKDVTGSMKMLDKLKEGKVASLPDETLDGRKVKVYERKGIQMPELKGTAAIKVWIDPKRLLPVRAQTQVQQGNKIITTVMNVLGWNEELDPKLFKLDVPKGYKVIEKPKSPKK